MDNDFIFGCFDADVCGRIDGFSSDEGDLVYDK